MEKIGRDYYLIDDGLHRFGTVIYNYREGKDNKTQVVASTIDGISLIMYENGVTLNPSKYRDGITNYYWSEHGGFYKVEMYQHKGNEFINDLIEVKAEEITYVFNRPIEEILGKNYV